MIDFSKITKTIDGYDCHYFGTRIGADHKILHCFAVWTDSGVFEKCYDENGRHLVCDFYAWEVSKTDAFAITKPPKIVEVTKWIGLFADDNGDYHLTTSGSDAFLHHSVIAKQKHTFRFEVPRE